MSDGKKTQPKSRGLPPHLTPGNPGNSGGKKGRSGRPPQPLKDFLAKTRQDPTVQDQLEKAAKDSESRGFSTAWKILTEYDDERPANKMAVKVEGLDVLADALRAAETRLAKRDEPA